MLAVISQERTVSQNRRETRSTPTRMVKINRDDKDKGCGACRDRWGGQLPGEVAAASQTVTLSYSGPSNSTPRFTPKRDENTCLPKNLYTNVHTTLSIHSKSGNKANTL